MAANELKLIHTVVLFRHGDRSPLTQLNEAETDFFRTQMPTAEDLEEASTLNPILEVSTSLNQQFPLYEVMNPASCH